jgi:hypothetical protein
MLTVHHPGGSARTVTDDLGRFDVVGVPAGPVSVRVDFASRSVQTEWVVL